MASKFNVVSEICIHANDDKRTRTYYVRLFPTENIANSLQ